MFQYQRYVPDPAAGNSEFLLGATTNCLNAELCGLLTPLRVVSIRNLSPAPFPCAPLGCARVQQPDRQQAARPAPGASAAHADPTCLWSNTAARNV